MTDLLDRVPPHSAEAEMATLGCMFHNQAAIDLCCQHVTAESFYNPVHRTLFQATVDLSASGVPVNIVLLREALREQGKWEEVGGDEYLVTLDESVPGFAAAEYYAKVVAAKARLRDLMNLAATAIRDANAADADPNEVADRLGTQLLRLSVSSDGWASPAAAILQALRKTLEAGEGLPWGTSTSMSNLDDLLHGFRPGNLIIVAARPSVGKSALLLNLADGMAKMGTAVGFFSLEMSKEEIAPRLLAARAEVNLWGLERGQIPAGKMRQIALAVDASAGLSFYIDDSPTLRIMDLRARVRRLLLQKKVEIVFVDYLQLIQGERKKADNREQEVGSVSRGLKALARECHIPVVVAAQLNRGAEDHAVPRLSNLRESGAIEQDADVVILLHQPDRRVPVIEAHVAKHRNGPTGVVQFVWRREFTQFVPQARTEVVPQTEARAVPAQDYMRLGQDPSPDEGERFSPF